MAWRRLIVFLISCVGLSAGACPPGTYGSGSCTTCGTNFYCPGNGQSYACTANSWSPAGASRCTVNAGYYDVGLSSVSYYTFNNGDILSDGSGVLGALTTAASPISQATGPFGSSSYSVQFTGSQHLKIPTITVTSTFSVCLWAYITSGLTANFQNVFDFSANAGVNDFPMYYSSDGKLHVNNVIPGTSLNDFGTAAVMTQSVWFHVCAVVSVTSGTLWVNGALSNSVTYSSSSPSFTLTSNYIGAHTGLASTNLWVGAVDEFRIFNKALSSTEISGIYNFRGDTYSSVLPIACTMTGCSGAVRCLLSGAAVCCVVGQYFIEGVSTACQACPTGTYSYGNTTSCPLCSPGSYCPGKGLIFACPANSWSAAGATACTANVGYYDLGSNLMAYYPFNPNQTLVDVSGRLGNLTAPMASPVADCTTAASGPGGSWASNCVSVMQANSALLATSPSAQFIRLPSFVFPVNFSLCFWYQATPYTTPIYYEFFMILQASSGQPTMFMQRVGTSTGIAFLDANIAGQYLLNWQPPNLYMAGNTWYHMCATFAGPSYNIYINGASQLSGTQTSAMDSVQVRDQNTFFCNLGGGSCFQGKMDELRLYNKSLSSAEVTALYNFRGDSNTAVLPLQCTMTGCSGTVRCTSAGVAVCCGGGQYFVEGVSTGCETCAAGTYGFGNATACTTCPNGTSSLANSSSCTPLVCSIGNYCPGPALTTTTPCPAGAYCPSTGLTAPTPCPAGSYCPGTSQTAPTPCPAGTYCPSTSQTGPTACLKGTYCPTTLLSTPIPCPDGSYCPSTGQNVSTVCPVGSYCPTPSLSAATPCTAGYYCPTTNMTAAIACPVGSYDPTGGGASACTPCPVGAYCPTTALTTPMLCPAGSYCPSTSMTVPIACPVGLYCPGTNLSAAVPCPAAYYCPNASMTAPAACQAGSYCPTTNLSAQVACQVGYWCPIALLSNPATCPVGSYCPTTSLTAYTPCPVGYTCPTAGMSAPTPCPTGTYCPITYSTDPVPCAPGYYCPNASLSAQLACAASTYSASASQTACVACATGSSSPPGASVCSSCPAGSYSTSAASTVCTLCVPGTFLNSSGATSSASCTECANLTYSTGYGATMPCASCGADCKANCMAGYAGLSPSLCGPCPAGKYTSTTGATACLTCGAGTVSQATATRCTACNAGTYASASGLGACTACAPGTYGAASGQTACIACSAGAAMLSGQTACLYCPAGTYVLSATQSCAACAVGSYCMYGVSNLCAAGLFSNTTSASSCVACAAGAYSSSASSTACLTCGIGTFSSASASPACPSCAPGSFSNTTQSTACTTCAAGLFSASAASTACSQCPLGSFGGSASLSACAICQPGSFSNTTQSTFCYTCPAGTYSPSANSTACLTCPTGTICPAGSSAPGQCAALPSQYAYYSGAATSLPCPYLCTAGYRLPSCSACPADFFCPNSTALPCPAGTTTLGATGAGSYVDCVCAPGTFGSTTGPAAASCAPCPQNSFCDATAPSCTCSTTGRR